MRTCPSHASITTSPLPQHDHHQQLDDDEIDNDDDDDDDDDDEDLGILDDSNEAIARAHS